MKKNRYPIGMQTFSKIIEQSYTYVDKTGYIKLLLDQGEYIFLSRPRRFGKSLLLSTLESYFKGQRELFKGLAADRMDLDWTPSPVLRFDLNAENYTVETGLPSILNRLLKKYERKYDITEVADSIAGRFANLIERVFESTSRKVVILIDEYDKPLIDVEDYPEIHDKNQSLLKSFYGNLKSMDAYLRFAFITGVGRFSKVSIFSDLNNLKDISMHNDFADICGWTEKELVDNFRPGIERLAEEREEDFDATLQALRDYYDGYLFTAKGSRLYNPYSVLNALDDRSIDPYWFGVGTPTFLVKRIRRMGTFPPDINGKKCTKKELTAVGMQDRNPLPLMFQTGYLTIWIYLKELDLYELRFPNREVEIGFYDDLLNVYVPDLHNPSSPFEFSLFKIDLYEGRPEDFMERLAVLMKNLPGEDHCESAYRAITYLLAVLCGTPAIAEHRGYRGRSDIEVQTGCYVYVFEFKYNKSVEEAMDQIKNRDYAGRYALDSRKLYLIGADFKEKKGERGLEYKIER